MTCPGGRKSTRSSGIRISRSSPSPRILSARRLHAHSVALHFMHYNFVKVHQSLRITPAMAAGVTDRLWEIEDLVGLLEAVEKSN